MSMMKGRVSRPAFLFATPPVDPGVTTHTGPNLFAFCLRLVCIEFVYILFSHSPFEQVCKRFPDAETVTLCDIRRRERRKLFMFCSYFAHKLHLLHACKQAQGSPTMNSERAGYIDQAHPPVAPLPL